MEFISKGKYNLNITNDELESFWNIQKEKSNGRIFFNSPIFCCARNINSFDSYNLYHTDYKTYLFCKEKNIPLYALGGFIVLRSSDKKLLIIKRSAKVGSNPSNFSLVGGYTSADYEISSLENIYDEVIREMIEEVGLSEKVISKVKFLTSYLDNKDQALRIYFFAESNLSSLELQFLIRNEIQEVENSYFLRPNELKLYCPNMSSVLKYVYDHYIKDEIDLKKSDTNGIYTHKLRDN